MLDLPPSAAVGRKIVAEQGFADRVSFREGDVFELGLGEDLDVVSIFNLIHHLPEERDRELCRMARAALRPGGVLVIGDSARPEPGEKPSSGRGGVEPALLRLEPQPQLRAVRGERLDARGRVRGGRGAPQRALALADGGDRPVILLTGATGTVGSALLRRLVAAGEPVRCLVRDPRGLGEHRVRVQIALGDLADPPSFRNALRGVGTVVHLAASIRDQPSGSIEELNAVATLRLVRAAERSGARRFLFFSAMGAGHHSRTRFFRAKALAQEAVQASSLETMVFRPSIVYTPGDPWLTLLERFSYLPALPVSGSGRAQYQPIWAEDVADCVLAALMATRAAAARVRARRPGDALLRRHRAGGAERRSDGGGRCCTCRCRWCGLRCGRCGRWPGPRCSPPGRRPS